MHPNKLYIPGKLKIGFNNRPDTYTGQLAYVIYYRDGELKKAKSWESWRDKSIEPQEYDNVPTSGFVLNKKAGGTSWGWHTRRTVSRVWDPRGFEFEVSIENLLFILQECDCSRGKGIQGDMVFAWDGTELVLLPVTSQEYKASSEFTGLQAGRVAARDLVAGHTYVTKKMETLLYLGHMSYFFLVREGKGYRCTPDRYKKGVEKRHVFVQTSEEGKHFYVCPTSLDKIAARHSDSVPENLAELIDSYQKSPHGSKPVRLFLREEKGEGYERYWCYEDGDTVVSCYSDWAYNDKPVNVSHVNSVYSIRGGVLTESPRNLVMFRPDTTKPYTDRTWNYMTGNYVDRNIDYRPWVEPTRMKAWVETEAGGQHPIGYSNFDR